MAVLFKLTNLKTGVGGLLTFFIISSLWMYLYRSADRKHYIHRWYLTPLQLCLMYPEDIHKGWKCNYLNASYLQVWWRCLKVNAFCRSIQQEISNCLGTAVLFSLKSFLLWGGRMCFNLSDYSSLHDTGQGVENGLCSYVKRMECESLFCFFRV